MTVLTRTVSKQKGVLSPLLLTFTISWGPLAADSRREELAREKCGLQMLGPNITGQSKTE